MRTYVYILFCRVCWFNKETVDSRLPEACPDCGRNKKYLKLTETIESDKDIREFEEYI